MPGHSSGRKAQALLVSSFSFVDPLSHTCINERGSRISAAPFSKPKVATAP
jgi:hypothetical protein